MSVADLITRFKSLSPEDKSAVDQYIFVDQQMIREPTIPSGAAGAAWVADYAKLDEDAQQAVVDGKEMGGRRRRKTKKAGRRKTKKAGRRKTKRGGSWKY